MAIWRKSWRPHGKTFKFRPGDAVYSLAEDEKQSGTIAFRRSDKRHGKYYMVKFDDGQDGIVQETYLFHKHILDSPRAQEQKKGMLSLYHDPSLIQGFWADPYTGDFAKTEDVAESVGGEVLVTGGSVDLFDEVLLKNARIETDNLLALDRWALVKDEYAFDVVLDQEEQWFVLRTIDELVSYHGGEDDDITLVISKEDVKDEKIAKRLARTWGATDWDWTDDVRESIKRYLKRRGVRDEALQ